MANFHSMPDLISSSVSLKVEDDRKDGTKYNTSGPIYPFAQGSKSFPSTVIKEISQILQLKEGKKIMMFLGFNTLCTVILLTWCHSTNSMALTAFTYLTIFDIFSLLTCLLSLWVQRQRPTPAYSFGYERFEVLAVFASTMLAQLGAFFIIKESIACLLQQNEVHTGRLLLGTLLACFVHLIVTFGVKNRAVNHVVEASSSSWLQEHMTDMSESLCHIVPGLSKILLPRLNPFVIIAFAGGISLFAVHILIDTKMYYSADTWVAVCIAIMTCGTLFPMTIYTGKILLQTAPSHILGQLDKVLREASTLDGVLEFRNEHFWTLSFGTLAGSLQVRVRRDADEQLVLAHVFSRLSSLVSVLTIQIFKDDWTRASTYAMVGSPAFGYQSPIPALSTRAQSPVDISLSLSSFQSPPQYKPPPASSFVGVVPPPKRSTDNTRTSTLTSAGRGTSDIAGFSSVNLS
ncbi:zinc transporter 6-A-like [Gigantopelta aegis]|uniref:zinc transporter 6-A-like n=1 Tax=Gigantopelta aegis TaxID=1735272 RepID=UPI001B88AAF7|nr:zinc transporter 6-A-like [Gigantopelta aegis]